MTRTLIDADYYLYRSATANEYEVEISPDIWTYLVRIDQAKADFTDLMAGFESLVNNGEIVLCLGDRTNFRYAVFPDYKASRRKYRRPAGLNAIREWASQTWPTIVLPNTEGDDVIGVSAGPDDVIVSNDKDLRTIPGRHLDGELVVEVTQWEADFTFYTQVLTGDATDGYPGCKGTGTVAARKALNGCQSEPEMWLAVLQAYIKAGHTVDFAVRMARCARILRPGEYDHNKKTPVLWCPPA